MIINPEIQQDFELLLRSGDPALVRSYFREDKVKNFTKIEILADKILIWGHYFMPHYLRQASPAFHRDIIKAFFSGKNEYIAAPRGFSKTTIIQLCIAYSVAQNIDKFIVIIEKSFAEAAEVIKVVHDEFIGNHKILAIYGNLVNRESLEFDNLKHQEYANQLIDIHEREAYGDVFINGVRIRGKGFNRTIRGLKSKQWRPSRIILDDIEEDEHIANPDQRLKYENNFDRGIQPAVDIDGSIKMFGTILHYDSLLQKKIDQHKGKVYRAHAGQDPRTAPEDSFLWPARWPREKLIKKYDDMVSEGKSSSAYVQELLNDPISEESRVFKWDWLYEKVPYPANLDNAKNGAKQLLPKSRITMVEFEKIRQQNVLNGYAMIDTADSMSAKADWTGSIVIFVAPNNARFVLHVKREHLNINDQVSMIFNLWKKWRPYGLIKIGVEKKGFEDQILPLIENEKERRQAYPEVEELKPMGRNKENRIKGALEGHIESGRFIFVVNKNNASGILSPIGHTLELLEELYQFPAAKKDDLSDTLAYSADIIEVPMADHNKPQPHHTPQDDPFEPDLNPVSSGGTIIANHEDPDGFE